MTVVPRVILAGLLHTHQDKGLQLLSVQALSWLPGTRGQLFATSLADHRCLPTLTPTDLAFLSSGQLDSAMKMFYTSYQF